MVATLLTYVDSVTNVICVRNNNCFLVGLAEDFYVLARFKYVVLYSDINNCFFFQVSSHRRIWAYKWKVGICFCYSESRSKLAQYTVVSAVFCLVRIVLKPSIVQSLTSVCRMRKVGQDKKHCSIRAHLITIIVIFVPNRFQEYVIAGDSSSTTLIFIK